MDTALPPRIGVIMGSTRPTRFNDKATDWFFRQVAGREDMTLERIDLRDVGLPLFDEPIAPAWGPLERPEALAWQEKLAMLDGFIFVTAEYNHGTPAVLKNALDYAYNEWIRKPAGLVAYGSVGGARAAEQLRLNFIELQMVPLRNAVHIAGGDFFAAMQDKTSLDDLTYLPDTVTALLDEMQWWASLLKPARQST